MKKPRDAVAISPMAFSKRALWLIGIGLALMMIIAPVYLLVKYSISDIGSINTGGKPIPFWPEHPTLSVYRYLFTDRQFFVVLGNSFIIALLTVACSLLLGVPAAYVLGRYRIPGRRIILLGIISVRLFPDIASVIPIVEFFIQIGAHQTYWCLTIF